MATRTWPSSDGEAPENPTRSHICPPLIPSPRRTLMKSRSHVAGSLACVAALALAGCANNASAGSGANGAAAGSTAKVAGDTIKIMVGGLNKQIYLPFMLAKQLGYYDKAGVNVSLQDEGAGVDATTQMIAGQVEGTGGFYDHTIALQGQGKFAESVVSML